MELLIAILILIVMSVFFMGLRAYLSFCALVTGVPVALTGLGGEWVMVILGLLLIAYALLAAYFTVRRSPRGMIRLQIFRFFGYGFFLFLQVTLTLMIILIPLARIFGTFARNYRDVIVVDSLGREIGRTIVDDHNQGIDGKQYKSPDDPY